MDAKSAARWAIDLSAGSFAVPAKRVEPVIVCIMATKGASTIPHSIHIRFYASLLNEVILGRRVPIHETGKLKPAIFGANQPR